MEWNEILMDEHRVIERMLKVLEVLARKLGEGEEVPPKVLEDAVDFIKNFADKCHHGKEEDILFAELEKKGMPREGGPIGQMLVEHDEGREYVKGILKGIERYKNGDEKAKIDVAKNVRNYLNLLSQHINKEDNILYPMGNHILSDQDKKLMVEKFSQVEKNMGEGIHQKYLALVEELEKKYL